MYFLSPLKLFLKINNLKFTGDPELELKLINFRLRNESIFENSKDPWK